MNDKLRATEYDTDVSCGCGCIVGDCYHIGCHCHFAQKVISHNESTNYILTKNTITKNKTTKTENNKTKED